MATLEGDKRRARILGAVLAAGSRDRLSTDIAADFQRLAVCRPPAEARLRTFDDTVKHFCQQAGASSAELVGPAEIGELPAWLASRVDAGASIAVSPQPELAGIAWPRDTGLDYRQRQGWAVVAARAGIAETGSLCFSSREQASDRLFLAENLVAVLDTSTIVARQEDLWRRLRRPQPDMPRAVHLVTGPSRTADVEQTLQVGAHGPRRLIIFLTHGPARTEA